MLCHYWDQLFVLTLLGLRIDTIELLRCLDFHLPDGATTFSADFFFVFLMIVCQIFSWPCPVSYTLSGKLQTCAVMAAGSIKKGGGMVMLCKNISQPLLDRQLKVFQLIVPVAAILALFTCAAIVCHLSPCLRFHITVLVPFSLPLSLNLLILTFHIYLAMLSSLCRVVAMHAQRGS